MTMLKAAVQINACNNQKDGLGYLRLENFLNDELVEYNKKSEL